MVRGYERRDCEINDRYISINYFIRPLRQGLPSLFSGTPQVLFSLMKKERKKSRLQNLCSDSLNKSLYRNPSRVNGLAIMNVGAALLRIARTVLFERLCDKIYLTFLPNLLSRTCRVALLWGFAGWFAGRKG